MIVMEEKKEGVRISCNTDVSLKTVWETKSQTRVNLRTKKDEGYVGEFCPSEDRDTYRFF